MSLCIFPLIILQANSILSNYLEVESNYKLPKLERNNIVNKGVWVRNLKETDKATSNFLFRGNSVDVDNIVQGDFNAFSDGSAPNTLYIANYVERNKRSPNFQRIRRYKENLIGVGNEGNTNYIENPVSVKSKMISKLKPSTVFNDYPYEIAILLGNNKQALKESKNYSTYVINESVKNEQQNKIFLPLIETINNISNKIDALVDDNKVNNTNVPKRSMAKYENEVINKIDYTEDLNNTQDIKEHLTHVDRDVIREDKNWHQNVPIPDTNRYKFLTKVDDGKLVRPVTERGLIKVLSMLTNTFKKIMKQHSDIKDINKKMNGMNDNFMKNIEVISDKFQDFEAKYANLVSFTQKISAIEEKLNAKEHHFKSKEKQLSKNLIEFEIQQKKFLTQQRQFYNIQKLMLAQNERINTKQNAISKTQSEISHRQNNFARILKKAKQIYVDNKLSTHKTTAAYPKSGKTSKIEEDNQKNQVKPIETTQNTTMKPASTESVKINLFSIPTVSRLQNQDHLLLNEKDEQQVDDLVYKYYFNNTLIDTLMKNFMSSFVNLGDNRDKARNAKNKRDEIMEKTTVLVPVNQPADEELKNKPITRERRWISHHSRKKWRHKNKGKGGAETNNVDDEKTVKDTKKPVENLLDAEPSKTLPNEGKDLYLQKSGPFVTMATNFCNGIGQNTTAQVLSWCVEKALRRLKNIDIKMPPPPVAEVSKGIGKKFEPINQPTRTLVTVVLHSSPSELTTTPLPQSEPLPVTLGTTLPVMNTPTSTVFAETTQNFNMYFPDNDKLESNLKVYDLQPDNEGNFYYDGSLHASELLRDDKDHEDSESDNLPGIDSNSRIDNNEPEGFDADGVRRAFLRRMKYESMLKKDTKL